MRIHGRTDRGKVRENNEDCFAFDQGRGIAVIADGMGGLNAGEVASACAVQAAMQVLEREVDARPAPRADRDTDDRARRLRAIMGEALCAAHRAVRERAATRRAWAGMATTLDAALVQQGHCLIGHVGDSRAYLFRSNDLHRITSDHSMVQRLVDAGVLSDAEARRAPNRHIVTRAVGLDGELDYDLHLLEWRPGDLLLLCSDGLTDAIDDGEIRAHCRACAAAPDGAGAEALVDALMATALARGAADNVTVVGLCG